MNGCSSALEAQLLATLRKISCTASYQAATTCRVITVEGAWGNVGDEILEIVWYQSSGPVPGYATTTFYNENQRKIVSGVLPSNSSPCSVPEASVSIPVTASSIGSNPVIADLAGAKYKVKSLFLMAAGNVTVRLRSGSAGNYLSGPITLEKSAGFVLPESFSGWGVSTLDEGIVITLDADIVVGGILSYVEIIP